MLIVHASRTANALWHLQGPLGEVLCLPACSQPPRQLEIGLLGTRAQRAIPNRTRRFAEVVAQLGRPVSLLDVRRSGVGGQGSWSPLEFASKIPDLLGATTTYSFLHVPCLAPPSALLEACRRAGRLPPLSQPEIHQAVEQVRTHHLPADAAWQHWQVFREAYLQALAPFAVLATQAFVETAHQRGGLAIFVCSEEHEPAFNQQGQAKQDTAYCHRYTLAAAVRRSLQQRFPQTQVQRLDLAL